MLRNTLRRWFKQSAPASGRVARRGRFTPRLELLEERQVLSNFLLQPLPPGEPISSYVGVGLQRNEVANLLGPKNLTSADARIDINWGNVSSLGELADLGPSVGGESYAVKGSNVYFSLTDSTDTITVTVTPNAGGQLVGAPQTIDAGNPTLYDMPSGIPGTPPNTPPLPGKALNVSMVVQPLPPGDDPSTRVGDSTPLVIGTLYASLAGKPDSSAGNYKVYVNWGDTDQWTTGSVKYNIGSGGTFQILGAPPPYRQPNPASGPYPVVAYVTGPDGTSASNETALVFVAPNANPVQATLHAPDVTDANAAAEVPYTFQVTYQAQGNNLVSASSVAGAAVEVQEPNGDVQTATLSTTALSGNTDGRGNAQTITATYTMNPANGSWSAAPLGTYTVSLAGSAVTDLNNDAAPLGTLGTFQANLALKLVAAVPQADPNVPEGGSFPLDLDVQGATGATDTAFNGPASVTLNGRVVATVNLHNGIGSANIPAGNQAGPANVQVQVTAPHYLQAGISVNVEGGETESKVKDFFKGAVENAKSLAETLEKLLKGTFEDANAFEKAAIKEFEGLAEKFGKIAKGLNPVGLVTDLVSLWNDYNRGDAKAFGEDFASTMKDGLMLGINWGMDIITETNPVGAVGGLVLNGIVNQTAETVFKNYLEEGFKTEGQNLFSALKGNGSSALLNGGSEGAPGPGDPPPAVLVTAGPDGSTAANLTAAGQTVDAAAGTSSGGIVATFLDASASPNPAGDVALIGWGDGSFSYGTVALLPGGGFSVSGTNTYATPGVYTTSVTLLSPDGSTAGTYGTAIVYPAAPAGAGPTASLVAPDITGENADWLSTDTFAVAYQAAGMISAASLAGATVTVLPPAGPALSARAIATQAVGSASALGDAATIVVTYQITPPGGNWYAAPQGTHTVTLGGTPVTDRAGHAIAAGPIGSFQVAVPPSLEVAGVVRVQVGTDAGIVNTRGLTLSGHAGAGATLTVLNGTATIGTTVAAADGSWTVHYVAPADGSYDFIARASTNPATPSADAAIVVDAVPPTSHVLALPATETSTVFTVSWVGTDAAGGSGILAYDVYVSNNGGPFTAWLTATPLTSADFVAQIGHSYRFYSVATDNAGNREATPNAAEASAAVTLPAGFAYDPSTQTLTITGSGSASQFGFTQATTDDGSGPQTKYTFVLNSAVATLPGSALTHVAVTGTPGQANTAVLLTNDTYTGGNGQTHETAEVVLLGNGGATVEKYDASGNAVPFVSLVGFQDVYATAGQADEGVIIGTPAIFNFFGGVGSYSYMVSGSSFYFVSGARYLYAYSADSYDEAVNYDGSGPSVYVASGTSYSLMLGTDHGQSFMNEGVGFRFNEGVATHAGDLAYLYDSANNDTLTGYAQYGALTSAATGEQDIVATYNGNFFAQVYAYAFAGGYDTATIYPSAVGLYSVYYFDGRYGYHRV